MYLHWKIMMKSFSRKHNISFFEASAKMDYFCNFIFFLIRHNSLDVYIGFIFHRSMVLSIKTWHVKPYFSIFMFEVFVKLQCENRINIMEEITSSLLHTLYLKCSLCLKPNTELKIWDVKRNGKNSLACHPKNT